MEFPWYYSLPLGSAVVYSVASVILKEALRDGAALRILFVSNLAMGLFFLPNLYFFQKGSPDWSLVHWPLLMGVLFCLGSFFTFQAYRVGDISVANPVLGVKILFVAIFSALFLEEAVTPGWWAGAVLATLAIALLGASKVPELRQRERLTILLACSSAASFALADILAQRYAVAFGKGAFMSLAMGTMSVISIGFLPLSNGPLSALTRRQVVITVAASALIAVQATGMFYTLATFGEATAVNILYSTRGLWSVLLIAALTAFGLSREGAQAGRGGLLRRASGAVLLGAAIVLVILEKQ
jgi:drug/metabolite transporter (DMT)-like permease